MNKKNKVRITLLADTIIIILTVFSLISIYNKPAIPNLIHPETFSIEFNDGSNVKLFKILKIEGIEVESITELEFICDLHNIGDKLTLTVSDNSGIQNISIQLVAYYDLLYMIILIIVGIIYFIPAVYVLWKRSGDEVSRIFHRLLISAYVLILFTWGRFAHFGGEIDYLMRVLHDASKVFMPVSLIHFSYVFPKMITESYRKITKFLYILAGLTMIVSAVMNFILYSNESIQIFRYYDIFHSQFLSIAIIILIIWGIFNFIYSFFNAEQVQERKKLKWLFLGFSIGPLVYILFWVVPKLLNHSPLIEEWELIAATSAAPITFTIAVFKYRIMNIDFIINRGVVYFVVIGLILSIYMALIVIISEFISSFTSDVTIIPSVISAVVIALLFEPVKRKTQKFIDKFFFKITYDFRQSQKDFIDSIRECFTIEQIVNLTSQKVDESIPVNNFGYFLFNKKTNNLESLFTSDNIQILENSYFIVDLIKKSNGNVIFAGENCAEDDIYISVIKEINSDAIGMSLLIISSSEDSEYSYITAFGRKRSHFRFTHEDIDLLKLMTNQSGIAIQRINLQKKYILQMNETQKLKELNELKSYFVSSVSHELKTPLTSIRMFSEILRDKIGTDRTENDFKIVLGECDRLSRLINNVLDFSKIEKGIKVYNTSNCNLNELIIDVIQSFEYQLSMNGFKINTDLYEEELLFDADPDSIKEIIINLISNAMKYSKEYKIIDVLSGKSEDSIFFEVRDFGIGISEKEKTKVFDPFYRSNNAEASGAGGAGIGLTIVRKIVQAHNGKIELQSSIGSGSSFKIYFKELKYENNINS